MENVKKVIDMGINAGEEIIEKVAPVVEKIKDKAIETFLGLKRFTGEKIEAISKAASPLIESGMKKFNTIINDIGVSSEGLKEVEEETNVKQNLKEIWQKTIVLGKLTIKKVNNVMTDKIEEELSQEAEDIQDTGTRNFDDNKSTATEEVLDNKLIKKEEIIQKEIDKKDKAEILVSELKTQRSREIERLGIWHQNRNTIAGQLPMEKKIEELKSIEDEYTEKLEGVYDKYNMLIINVFNESEIVNKNTGNIISQPKTETLQDDEQEVGKEVINLCDQGVELANNTFNLYPSEKDYTSSEVANAAYKFTDIFAGVEKYLKNDESVNLCKQGLKYIDNIHNNYTNKRTYPGSEVGNVASRLADILLKIKKHESV